MPESRINFGRNVEFRPRRVIVPRSEADIIEVLETCANEGTRVHVVGSMHSWSTLTECPDVLLDLREFRHVRIRRDGDEPLVEAGAGCTIGEILVVLEREGLTLPTLGAVDRQTIAGAVATATHGSGAPSLSHYVRAMRIACLEGGGGVPAVLDFDESIRGGDFRAARVGLGYLGVVVSVTLATVPQYLVEESLALLASLRDDVLAGSDIYPLQQFVVLPYSWRYYAFRRRIRKSTTIRPLRRRAGAWAYRLYKLVIVDVALHGLVKLMASRSRGLLIRLFFGEVLPIVALRDVSVVDRSDRLLTLRHDLYRHLEMEAFVPEEHVEQALVLVRHLTEAFARAPESSERLPDQLALTLKAVPGILETIREKRGKFAYHYVINCRRVLPETALLAMTTGDRTYYALGFFGFDTEAPGPFLDYCRVIAQCLVGLYDARLHWGKLFPLDYESGAKRMYSEPRMHEFREICRRYDPAGLLRNGYAGDVLGFEDE